MKNTVNRLWKPFVSRMGRDKIPPAIGALLLAGAMVARADVAATNAVAGGLAATNAELSDLSSLSIEQLMNLKVSILGSSETVSRTPAAVSVVTQDDIKRSGARNIPEALRLVPGLEVAQIDSSEWAVSARGFNDQSANKLLVLEDGRSIYTPLFSGVFWDVQNTMMEDIDHIEVVRGPGATVWGENAVNGVINIITKSAEDTQGWLVTGGGGTFENGFADARYGGKLGADAYYRVYGTYSDHAGADLPNGTEATNSWQMARGGFRVDWNAAEQNLITLQADGYVGWIRQVLENLYSPIPPYSESVPDDWQVHGADVLGRWTHTFSDTSNLKVQTYYDYTSRKAAIFDEERHTYDLSLQHEFALGERNRVVWGLGYHVTADTEQNNPTISFNPEAQTENLYSGFLQDELALVKDRLSLTFGTKLEHNDYTGFEYEPGSRLLWTPWVDSSSRSLSSQTFWASVSRAVRTPSRIEESFTSTMAEPYYPPLPEISYGTNGFKSETMMAYEVGYRAQPLERLSVDLAAYYNDYDHLRSVEVVAGPTPLTPTTPPTTVLGNDLYGHTYGVEISATWKVTDWWRLQPNYTYLHMDLKAHPAGIVPDYTQNMVMQIEGSNPQNQFSIRSSMDLPHGIAFDAVLRYVDKLSYFPIGSYFELDTRLGWRINKNWEMAIVGQNLLHDRHAEFASTEVMTQPTEIPRSVYGSITWHF
ncbi:MAG: TonB-dependent receptor [Verrucomicrobiota bacterium]